MESYLFNFLGTARKIKDFLVTAGPATLRSGADVLSLLADGARKAADYVEQFGPLVQFQRGLGGHWQGGVDSDNSQAYITELTALRDECAKQVEALDEEVKQHDADIQKQLGAGVNAGLLDWIGKIDPNTKKAIWGLLLNLITKVLTKSGVGPTIPAAAGAKGHKVGK